MTFKFNAKQVFLTFPKCPLSPEEILQALSTKSAIQTYTVARENHEDGTPHIHAVICFQAKVHTTNQRYFDVESYHPNIKGLKTKLDFKRASEYAQKDGSFISNLSKHKTATEEAALAIMDQGLTAQVLKDHPLLLFKNYNSIKQWLALLQGNNNQRRELPKDRHVWLHGPSNSGKTYWFRSWSHLFECVEIPENNDYSRVSDTTEILFVDEYRGFLTIQQLNKLCCGNTHLNTKGGSVLLPQVIVVILSNYTIEEVYKNATPEILDTLYNRFHQYNSSISMPPIPKYIIKL